MKLNSPAKIVLLLIFLGVSVVGFMIKLPPVFRHADKEMHSLFYFSAAAFLNLLFAKRSILWHSIIFIALYLFGIAIEFAQEYSNKLLHKRIHGRYDVEDVQANLKGLLLFSVCWIVYTVGVLAYHKLKPVTAKEG
jgi:hypothetical protein